MQSKLNLDLAASDNHVRRSYINCFKSTIRYLSLQWLPVHPLRIALAKAWCCSAVCVEGISFYLIVSTSLSGFVICELHIFFMRLLKRVNNIYWKYDSATCCQLLTSRHVLPMVDIVSSKIHCKMMIKYCRLTSVMYLSYLHSLKKYFNFYKIFLFNLVTTNGLSVFRNFCDGCWLITAMSGNYWNHVLFSFTLMKQQELPFDFDEIVSLAAFVLMEC